MSDDEAKRAAGEILNAALDLLRDRIPTVDELAHLIELAGPVLEGDPALQLLQILRRAASRRVSEPDSESMIDEIMDFHEAPENYSTHKTWFDQLYKSLEDAGSSRKDDVELSLRRLTPVQLKAVHNSLPNK